MNQSGRVADPGASLTLRSNEMTEARSVQISIYDNSGEIPRIVEDLPRSGNAPESLLRARASLLLFKHATEPMTQWRRLNNYYREWTREAGDLQVIVHKLSIPPDTNCMACGCPHVSCRCRS